MIVAVVKIVTLQSPKVDIGKKSGAISALEIPESNGLEADSRLRGVLVGLLSIHPPLVLPCLGKRLL